VPRAGAVVSTDGFAGGIDSGARAPRGAGGGSSVGSSDALDGAVAEGEARSPLALSLSFAACSSALISKLMGPPPCEWPHRRPEAENAGRTSAHRCRG
jgi:hypothetical protein